MDNSLGELFIQLAFAGDTKGAEDFKKSLKDVETGTGALIKAMKELTIEVKRLVDTEMKKAVQSTDEHVQSEKADTDAVIENTKAANENEEAVNETANAMQQGAEKALQNAKAQLENNEAIQEGNKAAQENNKTLQENNKQKKEQQNNIMSVSKAIAGYITAITGAIYAVKRLTDSLIEQNKTWLNLTRTSDIALSTYQKWNNVGKMYGVDQAASQIKNLNDRLFELKLTGANAQGFMLAGINPTNADDVMEQLRVRVAGLSDTSASYLLKQIGLDENMLHILRLSSEEFQALNNEVNRFQLTPEQRKSIQEMNVELQIAGQKLQYLKDRAILAILPYWTEFIKSITNVSIMLAKAAVKVGEFIKKFRGIFLILSGFVKLPKKLFFINFAPLINSVNKIKGVILGKLKPVVSLFTKFRGIITGLISSIPIFGKAIVKLGGVFSKAFLPLTALYLLLDDLAVFMNGGDSIIGDIVNYVKDFVKDFKNIFDLFNADPLYGLYAFLVKIADVFIKIARSILKVVDIMFGTPFAKWLDNWLESQNYQENLEMMRENLSDKAQQARNGELTRYAVPNINNMNTNNNTNAPTINIKNDIHTTETAKAVTDSFLPYTNELTFANRNFIPIGI